MIAPPAPRRQGPPPGRHKPNHAHRKGGHGGFAGKGTPAPTQLSRMATAPHPGRCRRLPGEGRDLQGRVAARSAGHDRQQSPIRVPAHPLIDRVVVSDGFDAADDWIAERAGPGAVVVTADILLADRCLKAGAAVLSPTGKPFTTSSIGGAIATRAIMADLRAGGDQLGGPPRLLQGRPLALPSGARHDAGEARLSFNAGAGSRPASIHTPSRTSRRSASARRPR